MKFIKGYKSYIIATLLVLVSLINMLTGDLTIAQALQDPNLLILLNGLGVAALRNGLS